MVLILDSKNRTVPSFLIITNTCTRRVRKCGPESEAKIMRILVVDDEEEIVELLRRFLERKNHSVDVAFDGAEALKLIKEDRYDIIFLDEDMPPGLTGLEVVEHIKKNNIKSKTVILTGYPYIDEKFSKRIGADEFLKKPVALNEIERIIKKYRA